MSRAARLSMTLLLVAACGEGKKAAPPQPVAVPSAPVQPVPFDAVAEAAASYRVVAAFAPPPLMPGKIGKPIQGALELTIEMTRPDIHVQAEFPLKVTLMPTAGLNLARLTLGHADAVDSAAKGRRWSVPVTAATPGMQKVEASLRFAICKEVEPAWCVVRNDTVSAILEVR